MNSHNIYIVMAQVINHPGMLWIVNWEFDMETAKKKATILCEQANACFFKLETNASNSVKIGVLPDLLDKALANYIVKYEYTITILYYVVMVPDDFSKESETIFLTEPARLERQYPLY